MSLAATSFSFEAIGTHWTIEIHSRLKPGRLNEIKRLVYNRIEQYDKTYSRFRADSLVTAVSRSAGTYTFPEDAELLFGLYELLYEATSGKITPLIGNLMEAAGYGADYSLVPAAELHAVPAWDDVMSYKHPVLAANKPVMLDFGAAGKGYLVDIIGELLTAQGVDSYYINAGGDILVANQEGEQSRIGLEHPADPTAAIGVATIANGSICCSGTSRRKWADLHHLMDPDTATPAKNIVTSWVTARTAMLADGVATALFFTDPRVLRVALQFEYCTLDADLRCERSEGFPAEIFTA